MQRDAKRDERRRTAGERKSVKKSGRNAGERKKRTSKKNEDMKMKEDVKMKEIVAEGGNGIGHGIAIRVNAIVIMTGTVTEMTGIITGITTVIIVTFPLIVPMTMVGEAIDANFLVFFFLF